MATIGLDKLYYAPITEDMVGDETYGTPKQLAKAISANIALDDAEGVKLYADDTEVYNIADFKGGTITLGVDDLSEEAVSALVGATIDANGALISASDDQPKPVAIGFRAKKANGDYRYFWLYRVLFKANNTELTTKGESISITTPTIEGRFSRRNKVDYQGKHPWRAQLDETTTTKVVTDAWYDSVYEPAEDATTEME